jgi:lysozyme family protein
MTIDQIIDEVLRKEGGFVNNPNDRGGATNWGITEAVARENGWTGAMRDLPRDKAREIYYRQYVRAPGFDAIIPISSAVAAEVVDTGVNMGPSVAGRFLQRALNVLNRRGRDFPDLLVDGNVGSRTIDGLRAYFRARGAQRADAERVLLRALNAQQGERYIALAERDPRQEEFMFGWFLHRVRM